MTAYYYRATIQTVATGERQQHIGTIEVDSDNEEYALEAVRDRMLDLATTGQRININAVIRDEHSRA